MPRQA